MNICVAMQYFKKLTQYWFRASSKQRKEVETSKDLCGKIFLHSFGGIQKEYKTGRKVLTSDTFSDNRITSFI